MGEKHNMIDPITEQNVFLVVVLKMLIDAIPWRIKHKKTYKPKYWNVSGRNWLNNLKNIATQGMLSVKLMYVPSSMAMSFAKPKGKLHSEFLKASQPE